MGQNIDPRFSNEKIHEAIEQLDSEEKPLNPSRVREKLGGGDHGRIKKILKKHASDKAQENIGEINDSLIPPEMEETVERLKTGLSNQLDKLAKSCFDVAMNTADLRVKSKIEEYNLQITTLENAEKDAFESIERSEKFNQDLMHKIEQLESKNETLVANNAESTALLITAKAQAAKLENKENEMADLRQQLGKLEGKLEALSNN